MPTGTPYFAWIDADEVVFLPGHLRWDENVFSFTLKQDEGDPASLTLVVRRPRNEAGDAIGLLGPGRKIWCWFAFDCGPDLIRFRGRLVGIPTSIFEELVTLEFVARPFDVVEQKEALAATLRVLPYYDEVVLDKERRRDPEVVLEGYSAIWHYDRETHVLTISDEITGEDGLVDFDGLSEAGKVFWDGLGLTLATGPLARVDVAAEYTWTQLGKGTVDLSRYIVNNWPHYYFMRGHIESFTLTASNWPKNGAAIGDGWTVADGRAYPRYSLKVTQVKSEGSLTYNFGPGDTATATFSQTQDVMTVPPGSIVLPKWILKSESKVTKNSISDSMSWTVGVIPLHFTMPVLVAGYDAKRQCTEKVTFSLLADVQSIMTDPEDGEALRVDDIRSVNLSEPIDPDIGTASGIPIGDARRRCYIATERGLQSLEHLIVVARAHLLKRSRVVEIAFAPKLSRMPEVTLRKNCGLVEPRIGEALGKIIGYSLALDGGDGQVKCEIRMGCTIGNGGSAVAAGGDPTYCVEEYTGPDYQQYTGRVVLFDSSVGYSPPNADPNDDGLDLTSALMADDVIDTPLAVENPPAYQVSHIGALGFPPQYSSQFGLLVTPEEIQRKLQMRNEHINNSLKAVETIATFKLKSMTREFSTDYEIQVTDLKIPTGYDLEAV